ncbi:HAF repeat-containing protein [Tautonia marina]|uniref:HAF repeat-containing protein n=1 Tax=Tautonia marina TaxID=2653855 RepID=UPI00126094B3|nr:HAF repeat-containing protein [Tautonia marina]
MRFSCLVVVLALNATWCVGADEPSGPITVVSPKPEGIIATGINNAGDVIGFEWIEEEERPGVVAQVPFIVKGEQMTYLPLLEGYTATFPAAVSDGGLVVGRVSKPMTPGRRTPLLNQGFVWDAERGIRGLGALEGDYSSFATGVSSDGRRISGFSVGDNRVRACVWNLEGEAWVGTALPHEDRLGSNVVAISDDGKAVSAVDGVFGCLWTEDDSGTWTRTVISESGALIPRAVNNAGMVVGFTFAGDGLPHAALWTRDGGYERLAEPEGYQRSEASDVNNHGVVVGMIDGPAGSEIGPDPFVYQSGTLRRIDEGGPMFSSATAINDQGQVAGILESDDF